MLSLTVDLESIQHALDQAKSSLPAFPYPWEGLEDQMDSRDESYFPLVGYGSLINQTSAAKTINVGDDAARQAVVAFGAKRIFNYRMPADLLESRYGMTTADHDIAALNCETTYRVEDMFNGILTSVRRDTLDALRDRERHYGLRPIVYLKWDDLSSTPTVAYIFECLPAEGIAEHPYDSSIAPQPTYTQLCRQGSQAISDDFLGFFDKTTFLADKATPLSETHFANSL